MTRDDLRRALLGATGEAVPTCLATLDDPGSVVHDDWPDQGTVPTSELLAIYRRRLRHTEDKGLPTLGFAEAVRQLEQTLHATLRLASVDGPSGHPRCIVFLAPTEPSVVAVLAMAALRPS